MLSANRSEYFIEKRENAVAFEEEQKDYIKKYIYTHIESLDELNSKGYFGFIDDDALRNFVLNQSFSTSIMYKFCEGMSATGILKAAEAKIQIILYLSFIEYSCDYLIRYRLSMTDAVKEMNNSNSLKKINLRENLLEQIAASVDRDPNDIVVSVPDIKSQDTDSNLRKTRFEDKLSLIGNAMNELDKNGTTEKLKRRQENREQMLGEIKELIYLRNNVHLTHEINRQATIDQSKKAYKVVKKFSDILNSFFSMVN